MREGSKRMSGATLDKRGQALEMSALQNRYARAERASHRLVVLSPQ